MEFSVSSLNALHMLKKQGYEAYFIGGCVRDHLLGRAFHDIDITTDALPEQIKTCFPNIPVIETGIQHGTVTVLIDGDPIEITTYRQDGPYSDSRHPDQVLFTRSLREDAARRDFTVNALACDENGEILDFFEGKADLEKRCLRCVGDPNKRFTEDALRILRALRFASVLGFEIEPHTAQAIFAQKDRLKDISAERIFSELCLLLCGPNAGNILTEYADVFGVFMEELLPMKGFDQKNPNHIYDILTHTARVVDAIEPLPHLRLAALFHDFGKPACFSLDENGIGHFYGHAAISTRLTEAILLRLKADGETLHRVTTLVKHHDTPIEETPASVKRKLNKIGEEAYFDLLRLMRADTRGLHPSHLARLPQFDRLEDMAKQILAEGECFQLKDLAVDGNDMMALGLQGPAIGRTLRRLLDLVLEGSLPNERAALLSSAGKEAAPTKD